MVNIIETKNKLIFDINKNLTKAELKQIKSLYAAKYNRSSYNRSSKKIKIKKREKING